MISGKKLTNANPSIIKWLMLAQMKLKANPAYVHSFNCLGRAGIINSIEPVTLKVMIT
jgi:hypothetical protein